jgi:LacI family transcriptional regulator
VAFADAARTTVLRPPLTVVAQTLIELGALATQHLIARIGGADGPAEVSILDTRFILRGSTAAPATRPPPSLRRDQDDAHSTEDPPT